MSTVEINGQNVNPSGPIQPIENGFVGDTPAPAISTAVVGPQGPPGPKGDTGPQGPAGISNFYFEFSQVLPSATWHIAHNLNGYPSVTVTDPNGNMVIGDVDYTDRNNLVVSFAAAFAGDAYLS